MAFPIARSILASWLVSVPTSLLERTILVLKTSFDNPGISGKFDPDQ
jgi:hypothetical protein